MGRAGTGRREMRLSVGWGVGGGALDVKGGDACWVFVGHFRYDTRSASIPAEYICVLC